MEQEQKPAPKRVGSGWVRRTEKGAYISLSFNAEQLQGVDLANCWVNLVKNGRKEKPKHPDVSILVTPKEGAPAPKTDADDPFALFQF